jgi:hypothetical protein
MSFRPPVDLRLLFDCLPTVGGEEQTVLTEKTVSQILACFLFLAYFVVAYLFRKQNRAVGESFPISL